MVIRLFLSAVAPGDLDDVIAFFREDVVPAFEGHPECLGVELIMSADAGVDGLVEGGALTRWTSIEAMEDALSSEGLADSQERIRGFLRREPIRKVYRVMV